MRYFIPGDSIGHPRRAEHAPPRARGTDPRARGEGRPPGERERRHHAEGLELGDGTGAHDASVRTPDGRPSGEGWAHRNRAHSEVIQFEKALP